MTKDQSKPMKTRHETTKNAAGIKHLDLFSGIGGFALAARWAGIETVGFSEIDDYATRVLRKNFPEVPNYGDIRKLTRETVGQTVDIITGGFPCQPFSNAGKRRGKDDDRDLWPEMFRVIKEFKPTWVLGENVAGFINMELERTIADLESEVYEVQPIVIPACAIGAPHRRDRVWIIAYAKSKRFGEEGTDSKRQEEWASSGSSLSTHAGSKRIQWERNGQVCRFDQVSWRKDGRRIENKTNRPYISEPLICRGSNGLPNRVDRIKCLGNAIVPQVAYEILKNIKATND